MPLYRGKDKKGPYYQWGNQKKYHYKPNNDISRKNAKLKAIKQMYAIYINGYRDN